MLVILIFLVKLVLLTGQKSQFLVVALHTITKNLEEPKCFETSGSILGN
jgi:hypothetical protein